VRTASRASRLIASGISPAEAAQILAENGDRDGLTALQDEVPSWTAVIARDQGDAPRAGSSSRRNSDEPTDLVGGDAEVLGGLPGAEPNRAARASGPGRHVGPMPRGR